MDPFLFASSLEEAILKIDHLEGHPNMHDEMLSFTDQQLMDYDAGAAPNAYQLLERVRNSGGANTSECGYGWLQSKK